MEDSFFLGYCSCLRDSLWSLIDWRPCGFYWRFYWRLCGFFKRHSGRRNFTFAYLLLSLSQSLLYLANHLPHPGGSGVLNLRLRAFFRLFTLTGLLELALEPLRSSFQAAPGQFLRRCLELFLQRLSWGCFFFDFSDA